MTITERVGVICLHNYSLPSAKKLVLHLGLC